MNDSPEKRTWIGLFGVMGPSENAHLDGCPGAYVTVLGCACDGLDFVKRVSNQANLLGLMISETVWCEPLDERLERFEMEEYLHALAEEARATGEVEFGAFHAWEADDGD